MTHTATSTAKASWPAPGKAWLLTAAMALATALAATADDAVVWLEREHDFGTIAETDGKVACHMRMVNIADTAITITEVRPTCGCTAADYPHHPIAPGDTASIYLAYNPYGRPGNFAKSVVVRLNAKPYRTSLLLKGSVTASEETACEMYPVAAGKLRLENSIAPFGKIPKGKSRNSYITCYNAGLDTLLLRATGVERFLTVRAEPDTVAPGATATLRISFDTSLCRDAWGLTESQFSLLAEPLRPSPTAVAGMQRVSAIATITAENAAEAPRIAVDSRRLDFSPLAAATTTRTITITNTGKSNLEVRSIECDSPLVSGIDIKKTRIGGGEKAKISVSVAPGGESLLNTSLTIHTNDPDTPALTVRLVGSR